MFSFLKTQDLESILDSYTIEQSFRVGLHITQLKLWIE